MIPFRRNPMKHARRRGPPAIIKIRRVYGFRIDFCKCNEWNTDPALRTEKMWREKKKIYERRKRNSAAALFIENP